MSWISCGWKEIAAVWTEADAGELGVLLGAVQKFIRSYVVMTPAQAIAVTLWIAHTHALDAFETTPFLAVTSPEKRCGKTRLLDVLALVTARPWRAIMPSEAVVYRKLDAERPTLLLDEVDAIFNGRNSNTEPLRALLNAGNRRGTCVPRCVGASLNLVDFEVFSAKVLAGIGSLPDTIADRAIPLRLARKRPDEEAERFRFHEVQERADPIHQALASWAQEAVAELTAARPAMPAGLDDRAEEAWEPLFAIAELAGLDWSDRALTAAEALSGDGARDEDALGARLLADIRDVFRSGPLDRVSSVILAATLCENEEAPWGDLRGARLDARGLARRLRPFEIRPRTIRLDDGTTPKGYHLEQFGDAFSRYLGGSKRHNATTRIGSASAASSKRSLLETKNTAGSSGELACGGVAANRAATGKYGSRRPSLGGGSYLEHLDRALAEQVITGDERRRLRIIHLGVVRGRGDVERHRGEIEFQQLALQDSTPACPGPE